MKEKYILAGVLIASLVMIACADTGVPTTF